jgi:hypothetical protein
MRWRYHPIPDRLWMFWYPVRWFLIAVEGIKMLNRK